MPSGQMQLVAPIVIGEAGNEPLSGQAVGHGILSRVKAGTCGRNERRLRINGLRRRSIERLASRLSLIV
jgi:hypothetical protein